MTYIISCITFFLQYVIYHIVGVFKSDNDLYSTSLSLLDSLPNQSFLYSNSLIRYTQSTAVTKQQSYTSLCTILR